MGSAMDALRKDLYGPSRKDADKARAYLATHVGLKKPEIDRIVRMTPYMEDDPVKAVQDTMERIAKGNTGFGNIDFEKIDEIGAEEEYLRQILLDRGVSQSDADNLIKNTKITENRRENIRRLAQTANRQQIDIGQEKRGWPGGAIGEDKNVAQERQSLASILTEYGATPEQAQQILDTAAITGTNRRVNLQHIKRAARQEGIDITWPEDMNSLLEGASDESVSLLDAGVGAITPSVNALGNWFASRPTPGGVAGLVFVMIVLWFAVIRVSGKMTRLELIWRTITGDADITLSDDQQQELDSPIPSMVDSVEKIIADVGSTLATGVAQTPLGKDLQTLQNIEHTAGTAINDFEKVGSWMVQHHTIPGIPGMGGQMPSPGFDARQFQGFRS